MSTMQIQSNNPFRDPSQQSTEQADTLPPAYSRYDRLSPVPSPGPQMQNAANSSANGSIPDPSYTSPSPHAPSNGNDAKNPFGSPFASNPSWSPSPTDHTASSIPSRSFQDKIKNRFARTAGDIFNPPCPSFARPLPLTIHRGAFESIMIQGDGSALADSFKPEYPGRILAPRDVSMADFARFLEDIAVAGRLEGKQQLISIAAPLTAHMGLAGHFVTKAIQKRMTRAKQPLCIEAIEHWCEAFFVPRGLDVFSVSLSEGRLTARRPKGEVPALGREYADLTRRVERDSSGSSDDEGGQGRQEQYGRNGVYEGGSAASAGYEGRGMGRGRGRGRGRGMARVGGDESGRRELRDARRAKRHDKFYLLIAPLEY